MLILIDMSGDYQDLENKLMDNNQKYFNVMQLEDFKKLLKEEEMMRKDKFKIKWFNYVNNIYYIMYFY